MSFSLLKWTRRSLACLHCLSSQSNVLLIAPPHKLDVAFTVRSLFVWFTFNLEILQKIGDAKQYVTKNQRIQVLFGCSQHPPPGSWTAWVTFMKWPACWEKNDQEVLPISCWGLKTTSTFICSCWFSVLKSKTLAVHLWLFTVVMWMNLGPHTTATVLMQERSPLLAFVCVTAADFEALPQNPVVHMCVSGAPVIDLWNWSHGCQKEPEILSHLSPLGLSIPHFQEYKECFKVELDTPIEETRQ